MKALVEYLAKSLVAHPDAVEVIERSTDTGTIMELTVAKEDLGRIIGKKGNTIKAIRLLVSAAASKAKTKVTLVIKE